MGVHAQVGCTCRCAQHVLPCAPPMSTCYPVPHLLCARSLRKALVVAAIHVRLQQLHTGHNVQPRDGLWWGAGAACKCAGALQCLHSAWAVATQHCVCIQANKPAPKKDGHPGLCVSQANKTTNKTAIPPRPGRSPGWGRRPAAAAGWRPRPAPSTWPPIVGCSRRARGHHDWHRAAVSDGRVGDEWSAEYPRRTASSAQGTGRQTCPH